MKNLYKDAIIGHTGYIGSLLSNKIKHCCYFNSKNIHLLLNKKYDTVYLCAPHSLKFWANKNAKKDLKIIKNLIGYLKKLKCNKIIYFSTTDIYSNKQRKNEKNIIKSSYFNHYGNHRYLIEKLIKNNFRDYLIIRLPALFGWKLKKNFFFDLLKNKSLKFYNKNSIFQWYFIEWIFKDLKRFNNEKIKTINLVSEPIKMIEIINYLKLDRKDFSKKIKINEYDIITVHKKFCIKDNYIYSRSQILKQMKNIFIKKFKKIS